LTQSDRPMPFFQGSDTVNWESKRHLKCKNIPDQKFPNVLLEICVSDRKQVS